MNHGPEPLLNCLAVTETGGRRRGAARGRPRTPWSH